jgi:hypothetical protein
MSVIWKEPPERGPGVWLKRLEPLLERPGEAALVYEAPSEATARTVRARLVNGEYLTPPGEWEFSSHKTEDGRGEVYARYLGPSEVPA